MSKLKRSFSAVLIAHFSVFLLATINHESIAREIPEVDAITRMEAADAGQVSLGLDVKSRRDLTYPVSLQTHCGRACDTPPFGHPSQERNQFPGTCVGCGDPTPQMVLSMLC
jgi:hypothetical protein